MRNPAAFSLLLALLHSAVGAGLTKEQQRIFALDKCNGGGGCFSWDSKQCLWHNEEGAGPFLLPATLNIRLKEVSATGVVAQYEAPGYKVKLTETDLKTCPTPTDQQCTVYKSKVRIEVVGPKGKQSYSGIGFCGS